MIEMDSTNPFTDPSAVASYVEGTPRRVPGFADLQRMTVLLLSERASDAADILVLGAGGGLELRAFREARPDWRLVGVDPSAEMLQLTRGTLGSHASEVRLVEGYIDDAPSGPFDGATCLLTLHFLSVEQRLHTLRELRRRLKPGAPLVIAHHSVPQGPEERLRWLSRSVAFAAPLHRRPELSSASAMAERLPLLSPEEDEALLREAGFREIALFYAALSFRGWMATA